MKSKYGYADDDPRLQKNRSNHHSGSDPILPGRPGYVEGQCRTYAEYEAADAEIQAAAQKQYAAEAAARKYALEHPRPLTKEEQEAKARSKECMRLFNLPFQSQIEWCKHNLVDPSMENLQACLNRLNAPQYCLE